MRAAVCSALGASAPAQGQWVYTGETLAEVDLADLLATNGGDGSEGFVLVGEPELGYAGESIALGPDINGDGIDEL